VQTGAGSPPTLPTGGIVPLWIPITVAAALFQNIRHDDAAEIRGI